MNGQRWTDGDDEALLELSRSCTDEQISAYMGRGVGSIRTRRMRLRRIGIGIDKPTAQHMIPFVVPNPPHGILLAKTCLGCGKLRDASYFSHKKKHRHGAKIWSGHDSRCVPCYRNARGSDQQWARLRAVQDALQAATLPYAVNSGEEYTSRDLALLEDITKPTVQVALELGRTYGAVGEMRRKMRVYPRKRKYGDSQWIIHFPAAAIALQKHFKSIGQPLPEDFWDLAESELASQDHRPPGRKVA